MFEYKKQFKTGLIADIGKMTVYNEKIQKIENEQLSEAEKEFAMNRIAMEELDNIIQIPLQIAYVFIKCANRNFMNFESWLETIEEIKLEDSWIAEVTELAVNSFLGQGTRGTTETIKEQK